MKCNKCKSNMINVDIVEYNGKIHRIRVCTSCGNTYTNRSDRFELEHLEMVERGKNICLQMA